MNKIIKEKIKQAFTLFIIIVAFLCVISVMLKYNNEGETKMPFNLTEMLVVSSADGEAKTENPTNSKWNLDVNQYNDIYLQFSKNDDYQKTSYIKNITIENIKVSNLTKGKVEAYMPNSTEGKLFKYEDNYIVNGSLTYNGGTKDNTKTLEVGNQGGMIVFRLANLGVSEYVSNDDDELSYDGKLLKKTGVNPEDIKFHVSFDVIITTDSNKYRATMELDLPCGDLENEGTSKLYDRQFDGVVFKRDNT